MLRNTVWAFGAQFIRLVMTLLLLRLLAPSERGLQSLLVLLPTVIATLSMFGVPAAVPVLLHRGFAGRRLLQTMWGVALVLALLLSLLFIPAMPFLRAYLQQSVKGSYLITQNMVLLGWLLLIPTLLVELLRSWLVAERRMRAYALSQIVVAVAQLLLALVLVWGQHGGAIGAVWAMIVGTWLGLLYTIVVVGDWRSFRPRLEAAILRPMFGLGLRAHIGNSVQLLNYRLDSLLIGPLLHTVAVGQYTTAVTLAELIWNIPNAVAVALLPHVAAGGEQTTPAAARHTLLLAGVSALLLLIGAWPLLLVVNPAYLPAWPALALLLPGVITLSLSKVLASDLGGRGLPQYASAASVVSLVVTVAGDLTLIPLLGIAGAALVSSVAYTLATLLTLLAYLRISHTPWRELLPGRAEFILYGQLLRQLPGRVGHLSHI